jgi:GTP-binding protein
MGATQGLTDRRVPVVRNHCQLQLPLCAILKSSKNWGFSLMSNPLVAVVGRPNVGKSTLFNRLVGKRLAIVEDTPGVTRDRLYAPVVWKGRTFTVIDTGGIILNETDPLTVQVRSQAEIAMDEADAILFVCDAADGITSTDQELADALRSAKAPVFLVVNKADNTKQAQEAVEFYGLGIGTVYSVSAVHGHGLADLLDDVVEQMPRTVAADEDEETVRLAVIGRPNVGKSSLVNAILGEERVIVSPIPGTTRDAIDTPVERDGQKILLIDTAGIRRAGKIQRSIEYYTVLRAKTAIDRCHVAVIVIDAFDGLTDGDKRVAGFAHEAGRACVIVVNKWDLLEPQVAQGKKATRPPMLEFTEMLRKQMPFLSYAPVVFSSAAYRFSVSEVLDTSLAAAANHAHRIPTGELNRLMRDAVEAHPRILRGKELKVYYATMPRVQPPTVLLFVNDPGLLHFSYLRYLENRLRETYRLEGTPIVIRTRKAENVERTAA